MPTITINNKLVEFAPGTTVLQAARTLDIEVPTLCYWEGVRPMNSCMLCVVRNTKTGQLLPSCSSMVQDGMTVGSLPVAAAVQPAVQPVGTARRAPLSPLSADTHQEVA